MQQDQKADLQDQLDQKDQWVQPVLPGHVGPSVPLSSVLKDPQAHQDLQVGTDHKDQSDLQDCKDQLELPAL